MMVQANNLNSLTDFFKVAWQMDVLIFPKSQV